MAELDRSLRLSLESSDALIPAVVQDMGNPPWEEAERRILILRLSPLGDLEGSTSHLVLFAECRRALAEAYLDFGFFPARKERAALASHNAPYFYGLASGREAADFDLVLVSNSFALELPNLSYLFSPALLPSRASEREKRAEAGKRLPIVILGGSNAACTGALLFPGEGDEASSDCLVDAIYFGEGEGDDEARGGLCDIARAGSEPGLSRRERLAALKRIGGLWVARSGTPASRRRAEPYPPALTAYPIFNTASASVAKLQISAGCPGYCSFCLEGWESRPYRELPADEIVAAARELKARSGASTLEVYSYNFNAHASIFRLIFELHRLFRRVNFMSQRLDILASSPELVQAELAADKRSFTLGIEGVSGRMRAFYRKGISQDDIEAALALLCRPSLRELKLFYILAGFEDEEDVAEFSAFAESLAARKKSEAPGLRILASAGYLVRLPFTPLEFAPLCLERERLESVARKIEGACAAAGIEFRLAADFEEYYVDQLLALGGRALGPWVEAAAAKGLSYDGGLSRGTGSSLELFAREAGILSPGFTAEKGETWRPPLGFSDDNHEVLRAQYLLASGFSPKEGRLPVPEYPGAQFQGKLERLMAAKRAFASVFVRLSFPPELARARPEYRATWIMRRIFAASPESVAALFDAEEALFSAGGSLEDLALRYWGKASYRLVGPDGGRIAAAAAAAGFEVLPERPEPEGAEARLSLSASFGREAEEAIKGYLAEERISFIEAKDGDARVLECSKADRKKKTLLEAVLCAPSGKQGGEFSALLELGRKARLEAILSRLSPEARRASSIEIVSFD
jgi:hypothetical protein